MSNHLVPTGAPNLVSHMAPKYFESSLPALIRRKEEMIYMGEIDV
jgi:hypothetical protein